MRTCPVCRVALQTIRAAGEPSDTVTPRIATWLEELSVC